MKFICSRNMLATIVAGLFVALVVGCSEKKTADNKAHTPPSSSSQSANSTTLNHILTLWQSGDQNSAIQQFIDTDWKTGVPVAPGSSLSLKETELPAMTSAAREKHMAEVMVQMKDLKALASAVRDKAITSTDKDLARRHFTQIDDCGAALDQPDALQILQLNARALRRMAAAEMAKLGQ